MSDVGLPRTRTRRWVELSIVVLVGLAAVIGAIVRAKDAPFAPMVNDALPTAAPRVTSLDGLALRPEEPLFALDGVTVNGKVLPAAALNAVSVRPADAVGVTAKSLPAGAVNQISVRATDTVGVFGWAADRVAGVPANSIFVAVGSGKPIEMQYGGPRADVAKALGNPKLDKTGFAGKLPPSALLPGIQPLHFFVVNGTASGYGEVPSPLSLVVK